MSRDDDDSVDRKLYEEETRKIRFNTYRYANSVYELSCCCLGHHADDLSENILMNIFKGRDLLDLSVMEESAVMDGITIVRPMLFQTKKDIYDFADNHFIPYTKDTTPHWSCRGVMRRKILPAITAQFGEGAIENIAKLGQKSKCLDQMIEKLLDPLFDSIVYGKLGCYIPITSAYGDDHIFWTKIFREIFVKLEICNIKNNSLDAFFEWFGKKSKTLFIHSNKCISFLTDGNLYIFSPRVYCKENWQVNIQPADYLERDPICYEDIINGRYSYSEMAHGDDNSSASIRLYDKYSTMSKLDTTRKIFTKIPHIRDMIPKYSSGAFRQSQQNRKMTCFSRIKNYFLPDENDYQAYTITISFDDNGHNNK